MLDDKIVDLLAVGWPDFVVMDAVEVGVGNEAMPTPRRLGLLLMGRNPIAVDLVAARLLGFDLPDVSYLERAVERGHLPDTIEKVSLAGDLTSLDAIDEHARRLMPYDDEYRRWHDVGRELSRMESPIRFFWGPYRSDHERRCLTGCVMGLKMFLAFFERFAGPEAFARAKPVVFVIGRWDREIDAGGHDAFLIGSCAQASITNAKKVVRLQKCFTTAGDMMQTIGHRLGMPSPFLDPPFLFRYMGAVLKASSVKLFNGRYFQDMGHFVTRHLIRKV